MVPAYYQSRQVTGFRSLTDTGPTPKELRMKCWNCGQHGHFEKDCKHVAAVTDENEELCDDRTNDVTEYYDEDWMELWF